MGMMLWRRRQELETKAEKIEKAAPEKKPEKKKKSVKE